VRFKSVFSDSEIKHFVVGQRNLGKSSQSRAFNIILDFGHYCVCFHYYNDAKCTVFSQVIK